MDALICIYLKLPKDARVASTGIWIRDMNRSQKKTIKRLAHQISRSSKIQPDYIAKCVFRMSSIVLYHDPRDPHFYCIEIADKIFGIPEKHILSLFIYRVDQKT